MQRVESRDEMSTSLSTINNRQIEIETMQTNDKYIICSVRGFFNEKDEELRQFSEAIFVFDWELNPIKKFDLPYRKMVIIQSLTMVVLCTSVRVTKMASHCIKLT